MIKSLKFLQVVTFLTIFLASPVQASEVTIRPFLIDETMTARDVIQRTITVSSDYDIRKAVLYATVNEISVDNNGEIKEFMTPVMTDRTNTVTSWVEISRGRIEIPPKESREVPLTIRTHPYAEPGEYHVFIGIVEAQNRPEAQAKAMAGDAKGVIVKITIADKREDSMKISSFTVDRFITGDSKKDINIEVQNLGEITSAPEGEIIFYDSKGVEVASIPVSSDPISPGESGTIKSKVPIDDKLGRYKMNLTLSYGESQTANLFDTSFFFLMPLHLMIIIFVVVLVISLFIVFLFRRSFGYHDEDPYGMDEVALYVKDGHDAKPQEHDIDLKK